MAQVESSTKFKIPWWTKKSRRRAPGRRLVYEMSLLENCGDDAYVATKE
jgi:hypothetical protein